MAHRHYLNAPITEAVIDIQVSIDESVDLSVLKSMFLLETDRYPNQHAMNEFRAQFATKISPTTPTEQKIEVASDAKPLGWIAQNPDKCFVWQARRNGFTLSRLAPYTTWEAFRDEARRLWGIYRSNVSSFTVNRIALRYINRLDLPIPLNDFREYLRTFPEIAPDMNQGISTYFMQLQIPYPQVGAMLNLGQGIVEAIVPETVAVVLDIDLWRVENIDQHDDVLWSIIEELHESENLIFESCLTDDARRLFR